MTNRRLLESPEFVGTQVTGIAISAYAERYYDEVRPAKIFSTVRKPNNKSPRFLESTATGWLHTEPAQSYNPDGGNLVFWRAKP